MGKFIATAVVLLAVTLAGCRGGRSGNTGSNSTNEQGNNQKQNAQRAAKPSTGTQKQQFTEPDQSTTGKPSAASDRGSPGAVAHESVAEPGAPEGTMHDADGSGKTRSQPRQSSPQ